MMTREIGKDKPRQDLVVLKLPYTSWIRRLGLRHEFSRLKASLQLRHGTHVLKDTKFVVANPVSRCIALDTYSCSTMRSSMTSLGWYVGEVSPPALS